MNLPKRPGFWPRFRLFSGLLESLDDEMFGAVAGDGRDALRENSSRVAVKSTLRVEILN